MLCNTYHLANEPGGEMVDQAGGIHDFMNWSGNVLTDSGGFQMVSLSKICNISEEGVTFESVYRPGDKILLTPEESINIQVLFRTYILTYTRYKMLYYCLCCDYKLNYLFLVANCYITGN